MFSALVAYISRRTTKRISCVRVGNTDKKHNSIRLDSKRLCRKFLAHPRTYATDTVLKAILITLSNVPGNAYTIFYEIVMSILVSLKPLWRGDIGREEPLVLCYDAMKDTWCENRGIQIQVGHIEVCFISVLVCSLHMASDIRKREAWCVKNKQVLKLGFST